MPEPPGDVPEFIPPPRRTEPLRVERPDPLPPPPPSAPTAVVEKRTFFEYLGERAARRPEPRLGVSVAGAGSAMLVVGALVISGDQLFGTGGSSNGDGSQFPGLLITGLVVVAGVVLAAREKTGPLAAAGVTASAIALPPLIFFLTYSKGSIPPIDTILLLSTIGWLAGYVVGPARGHSFYLGVALLGFWIWLLESTEHVFTSPLNLFGLNSIGEPTFGASVGPDPTTIGTYTLGFGVVYLIVARVLDRRGRRGMATPFVFAGIVTLIIGLFLLADDLDQIGTGVAFAAGGLALCYLGATESRRATNWVGAVMVFYGVTALVAYPFDDPGTAFGVAEIVVGGGVIVLAHWFTQQFHEPRETDAVLSRYYSVGSVQPSGPPPPPAGSVLG